MLHNILIKLLFIVAILLFFLQGPDIIQDTSFKKKIKSIKKAIQQNPNSLSIYMSGNPFQSIISNPQYGTNAFGIRIPSGV